MLRPKYYAFEISLTGWLVFVLALGRLADHLLVDVPSNGAVGADALLENHKDKPTGQGDFQSIIFWTNDQANTMLTRHRFVFFASPWSTGKTLLMREKAVLWAKENPSQKLFFTVIRCEFCQLTSLLEMELEFFFHQKHQLHNVEVLGITTGHDFKDALSSLLNEVTTRPPGSWMVDELIMPGKGKYDEEDLETVHEQWTNELVKIQSYVEAQAGILWIACAGIEKAWRRAPFPTFSPDHCHPASLLPAEDGRALAQHQEDVGNGRA